MSEEIERTSVTLPAELLAEVDEIVEAGDYDSRSEATRDALRAFVTEFNRATPAGRSLSGTVVVLYDHHASGLSEEMTGIQHDFEDTIIAVHHVHLGADLCLESLAIEGTGEEIEELVGRLRPLKGVKQVKLTVVEAEG